MTARKTEVAKPAEPEITTTAVAEVAEVPAPEVTKPAEPDDAGTPAVEVAVGDADDLTIVMMVTVAGTHDGEPWPARGQQVTLPRIDAEEYLRLGYAKPVDPVD